MNAMKRIGLGIAWIAVCALTAVSLVHMVSGQFSAGSIKTWSPIVLLGVTAAYVLLTGHLLAETTSLRRFQTQPQVNVLLRMHRSDDPNFLNMVIKNSGHAEARNIRLVANPDFVRDEERQVGEGRML